MLPRSVFSRSVVEDSNNEDIIEESDSVNSESNSSNSIVDDERDLDETLSSPGRKIVDKSYLYTAATMLNYDGTDSIPQN